MGHQDWNSHVLQHMAGGAPEYEFAHSRVRIGTHHNKIGAEVIGAQQKCLAGVAAVGHHGFGDNIQAVTRQGRRFLRAWNIARFTLLFVGVIPDDTRFLDLTEER